MFGKVPNVRSVSNYVNPKLNDYVNKSKAPESGYGVCILDFIDESLSKTIVNSNVFTQYIIVEPVWIWR
jgi:1-phosphatidylinositol phosphodiesterase